MLLTLKWSARCFNPDASGCAAASVVKLPRSWGRRNKESAARMRLRCGETGKDAPPLPPAARRPASREHGSRRGREPLPGHEHFSALPASCPVLPLRDDRRFARGPGTGRFLHSRLPITGVKETSVLRGGTKPGGSARELWSVPLRGDKDIPRVSLRPCTGPKGEEKRPRPHTVAERRPSRSGSAGHDAGKAEGSRACEPPPARGVTRDPRSRSTRSGLLSGSHLPGCFKCRGRYTTDAAA